MPKSPPPLTDRVSNVSTDPTEPARPQASSTASQDASKPETQQAEKLVAKSYRFPVSHARQFAAWATMQGLTEQEATRLAQIAFMENYHAE